jgi:hypothetical protein
VRQIAKGDLGTDLERTLHFFILFDLDFIMKMKNQKRSLLQEIGQFVSVHLFIYHLAPDAVPNSSGWH